jgi:uncharacterized repeat protein (TIGR01451 family)
MGHWLRHTYRRLPPGSSERLADTARVPAALGPQMITIAPDGASAYVTATGGNTIWQDGINPATGRLTPKSPAMVATGHGPHDLAVALSQFAIGPRHRQDQPLVTGHRHRAVPRLTRRGGHPDAGLAANVSAPATARHGSALTYTITITDVGPSPAWQLALASHLPAGTAFRTATARRGHCTAPHTGARGATVQCQPGGVRARASTGPARNHSALRRSASHASRHRHGQQLAQRPRMAAPARVDHYGSGGGRPGASAAAAGVNIARWAMSCSFRKTSRYLMGS